MISRDAVSRIPFAKGSRERKLLPEVLGPELNCCGRSRRLHRLRYGIAFDRHQTNRCRCSTDRGTTTTTIRWQASVWYIPAGAAASSKAPMCSCNAFVVQRCPGVAAVSGDRDQWKPVTLNRFNQPYPARRLSSCSFPVVPMVLESFLCRERFLRSAG